MKRIYGLDILRAIAIFLVMLCHYLMIYYAVDFFSTPAVQRVVFCFGFMGVEIFFVLSGYLMGRIFVEAFDGHDTWQHTKIYYARRWLRTLPLYYLALVTFMLVQRTDFVLQEHWTFALFMQNLYWPMPGKFFAVSWSLTIEELFYFIFPLILLCLGRATRLNAQHRVAAAAWMLIVICTVLKIHNYLPEQDFSNYFRNVALYRLDAIAIGVLLYIHRGRFRRLYDTSRLVVPVGIIYAILLILPHGHYGDLFQKTLMFPLLSLAIAMFFPAFERLKPRFDWQKVFITRTSNMAYTLYLFHLPVLLALREVIDPVRFAHVYVPLALICTWYLCTVLNRYVERPIMKARPRHEKAPGLQPAG